MCVVYRHWDSASGYNAWSIASRRHSPHLQSFKHQIDAIGRNVVVSSAARTGSSALSLITLERIDRSASSLDNGRVVVVVDIDSGECADRR